MNGAAGERVCVRSSTFATRQGLPGSRFAKARASFSPSKRTGLPWTSAGFEAARGELLERDRGEARFELARLVVEVAFSRDEADVGVVGHRRLEGFFTLFELGFEVPVRGGDEEGALGLAEDEEPDGHALHAARREARGDLPPQERRDGVADEPIEDAPRLLGLDEVGVDVARALEGVEDGLARDLVEDHAADGHLRLEHLQKVPPDGFAFAVLVRGDVELVGVLER